MDIENLKRLATDMEANSVGWFYIKYVSLALMFLGNITVHALSFWTFELGGVKWHEIVNGAFGCTQYDPDTGVWTNMALAAMTDPCPDGFVGVYGTMPTIATWYVSYGARYLALGLGLFLFAAFGRYREDESHLRLYHTAGWGLMMGMLAFDALAAVAMHLYRDDIAGLVGVIVFIFVSAICAIGATIIVYAWSSDYLFAPFIHGDMVPYQWSESLTVLGLTFWSTWSLFYAGEIALRVAVANQNMPVDILLSVSAPTVFGIIGFTCTIVYFLSVVRMPIRHLGIGCLAIVTWAAGVLARHSSFGKSADHLLSAFAVVFIVVPGLIFLWGALRYVNNANSEDGYGRGQSNLVTEIGDGLNRATDKLHELSPRSGNVYDLLMHSDRA